MHERVVECRDGCERRLRVAVISGVAGQMLGNQPAMMVSASALERSMNQWLEAQPAGAEILEVVPWGAAVLIVYRAAPVAQAVESEASTEHEVAEPSPVLVVPWTARVS